MSSSDSHLSYTDSIGAQTGAEGVELAAMLLAPWVKIRLASTERDFVFRARRTFVGLIPQPGFDGTVPLWQIASMNRRTIVSIRSGIIAAVLAVPVPLLLTFEWGLIPAALLALIAFVALLASIQVALLVSLDSMPPILIRASALERRRIGLFGESLKRRVAVERQQAERRAALKLRAGEEMIENVNSTAFTR